MNYNTATLVELRAEFVRLAGVVADAQDARKMILSAIEQRETNATAKVERMSEVEREAMREALKVKKK